MKRDLRLPAAVLALLGVLSVGEMAFAQKQGGILRIGQFDSPAGMSILEESSNTAEGPMMGVFNNLVLYDQDVPQNSLEFDPARPRHRLVMGRGQDPADLPPAPGRQMARRQTVYGAGRQVHLGSADRQVDREAAPQPAQGVVPQPAGRYHQRRLRGHVQSAAAPAGAAGPIGVRLGAHLSLRCAAGADAPASDRHRPVQIRRIQAQ